jgi:hypothetical protein
MIGFAIRLLILSSIKIFAKIAFKFDVSYRDEGQAKSVFDDIKLAILLNHTSLAEPLFLGAFPWKFVRQIAHSALMPIASETGLRPLVGRLFKILAPNVVLLSRKRDSTWTVFLEQISSDSLIMFIPEGRMKRRNGLDKNGQPMSLRGGICDILQSVNQGRMLIAYSGGLHSVNCPGEAGFHMGKHLAIQLEAVDLESFLKPFFHLGVGSKTWRDAILIEFTNRRDIICPGLELKTSYRNSN